MVTSATPSRAPRTLDNLPARYAAARQYIAEHGIQIRHLRQEALVSMGGVPQREPLHHGGLTLAFRQVPGGSIVQVATAVCSAKDAYCRRIGTALAVEAFANGQCINLPNYADDTAHDVVETLFGSYYMAPGERYLQDDMRRKLVAAINPGPKQIALVRALIKPSAPASPGTRVPGCSD